MRVLMTSTPGTGHVYPLVPLARALVEAGHEIVWATAPSACPIVERLGFRAVPCGLDREIREPRFIERAPHIVETPVRDRRAIALSVMFGEVAAPVMRDDLTPVFERVEPQLVIHELSELAATPMASAHGIPSATVGFSGALSDSVQTAVLSSLAPLWRAEGVDLTAERLHGDVLLHPFPTTLDTPRGDGPAAPMQPLSFDGATTDQPPRWLDGFGRDRPGVYVTFGTEVSQRAPWTEILGAMDGLDVDVVATVGAQLDPASLGALPANVRVEAYVPQGFLIDRAHVVVSHAGAGTLIGAGAAGKVQLCVPISADQWDNADAVAGASVGLTLEPDERDAASVHRSIQRLLDDAGLRANASSLRDAFAEMPNPTEIVPNLEALTG